MKKLEKETIVELNEKEGCELAIMFCGLKKEQFKIVNDLYEDDGVIWYNCVGLESNEKYVLPDAWFKPIKKESKCKKEQSTKQDDIKELEEMLKELFSSPIEEKDENKPIKLTITYHNNGVDLEIDEECDADFSKLKGKLNEKELIKEIRKVLSMLELIND